MKAQDVKVGMVVWDKVGRAYVRVSKPIDGNGLVGVSLGGVNMWCRVPPKGLRPLTAREKGLTK